MFYFQSWNGHLNLHSYKFHTGFNNKDDHIFIIAVVVQIQRVVLLPLLKLASKKIDVDITLTCLIINMEYGGL